MIRAAIALFFAVLAVPAQAIDIQQVTSPGGIKAWLVEDHSIPFTALSLDFKGGASLDPPGKRGAINLMTGLLEEGAGKRDATAFAQAVEDLGARLSFDVSDDSLSVSLRALTENRDQAADLLAQALTQPRFDDRAVERVRAQVQAIIRSEATDPQSIARKELARQAWGDHPYATSINGTEQSIATLERRDLVAAKNRVLARRPGHGRRGGRHHGRSVGRDAGPDSGRLARQRHRAPARTGRTATDRRRDGDRLGQPADHRQFCRSRPAGR